MVYINVKLRCIYIYIYINVNVIRDLMTRIIDALNCRLTAKLADIFFLPVYNVPLIIIYKFKHASQNHFSTVNPFVYNVSIISAKYKHSIY